MDNKILLQMNKENKTIIQDIITSIHGKKCWHVSCGGCVGTSFQLAIGNKIPRKSVLDNKNQTDEFRMFKGEIGLLIWSTWRLDSKSKALTSSDDTEKGIKQKLNLLLGFNIEETTIDLPCWDMHLLFTNGLKLHVFCDHVPGDPSYDGNWYFEKGNKIICFGPGENFEIEKH